MAITCFNDGHSGGGTRFILSQDGEVVRNREGADTPRRQYVQAFYTAGGQQEAIERFQRASDEDVHATQCRCCGPNWRVEEYSPENPLELFEFEAEECVVWIEVDLSLHPSTRREFHRSGPAMELLAR